ncbi:hypothetical protein C1646_751203 [Rhizophagus diaphanus]|nr:hypothetical protein C1646_751203 [Rhizophagus diaphanus] [Rhizophagus sp. MUCL 43196]
MSNKQKKIQRHQNASSKTSLTSSSKISRKKSAEIINLNNTSMVDNDIDSMLFSLRSEKSADISNVVNVDLMMLSEKEKPAVSIFVPSGREKLADIINIDAMMTSRKNSNEITEKEKSYVISEEFNYTMNLLNSKVSALYKLCRYISDQQQENSKSLEKLVTLDELSDFWNMFAAFGKEKLDRIDSTTSSLKIAE